MAEAPTVTVYSTTTCPWCDRTKEYLRSKNVPFKDVDVSADIDAAREMVRISGQQGVPVVATDQEVIVMAAHKELDKLIRIQIGPVASPKEAEAMRKKMLADG